MKIASQDFYHLKTKGSIAQNSINDIVQDTIGQIWIATKNGIIRYNGKKIHTYIKSVENKNAIGNNYVTRVFIAKNGELWATTQNGASKYNYEKDIFENIENERFKAGLFNDVFQDTKQNLWFLDYKTQSIIYYNEKKKS